VAPKSAPVATALDVSQSVVIVEGDGADVDRSAPWASEKTWTRVRTGLVVDGHQILVTGWGLENHKHVTVQKLGSTAKLAARAVKIDPDAGFMLLTVDDPAFWKGLPPAALADANSANSTSLRLLHATTDGARVEATSATVAGLRLWGRAEFVDLKLSQVDTKQLAVSDVLASATQVFGMVATTSAGDDVLALRSKTLADFVAEAQRPTYRGYPSLGLSWQTLTSVALRAELGLGTSDGGIRVTQVYPGTSADGVIAVGDVLLTIEGKKIESDGTIAYSGGGRLGFAALNDGHHAGDVVALGLARSGVRQTVNVTLKVWSAARDLVPWQDATEARKAYALEGGLVFENLSGDAFQAFGKDWDKRAPPRLVEVYWLDRFMSTPERSRIVVLTRVLPDPATLGYQNLRELIVESINGVKLRSLDDVHPAFAKPEGGFDTITFAPGQRVRRIVLDAQEARAANDRLRATYERPAP
jgi:S1-C subfamily serine protease